MIMVHDLGFCVQSFLLAWYIAVFVYIFAIKDWLNNISWETDLWVTLGDFTLKTEQNWEGKYVFNWKLIR